MGVIVEVLCSAGLFHKVPGIRVPCFSRKQALLLNKIKILTSNIIEHSVGVVLFVRQVFAATTANAALHDDKPRRIHRCPVRSVM